MENILIIASLLQKAYSKWLCRQLLLRIIVIAGLIIVIAIMVAALLVGGLYASYFSLRQSGLESQMAMLTVGIFAIFTILILVLITLLSLHKLRKSPTTSNITSNITSNATGIIKSFTDGFMSEQDKKPL